MKKNWGFLLLPISCFLFLIYSFSQVDLNLTLSTNSLYLAFQKQLTQLGFFNRPLSTAIFILIIFIILNSYFIILEAVKQKKLSLKQIWLLIGMCVGILLFSYPAFSHDIFNYLFDARVVTKYGMSPWHVKPLDFPSDTWIRFMRWTHRPTVYPPIWIGLSLIPSFLGFAKFLPTLYLFKIMATTGFLGSCLLIYKLAQKLKHKNPLFTLVLFAFNPLVIIETLVNGHSEIIMIFLALLALYLSLQSKKFLSWITYISSVGIKYMTFYLLPALINIKNLRLSIRLGSVLIIAFILWYGFQPWYLLWILPFAMLLNNCWERNILLALSLSLPFWYIPKVYFGDFDLPSTFIHILYILPMFIAVLIYEKNKKLI